MPLPAKTIHDYQRLARDNGLVYDEIFAPSTVWVKVRWHCDHCGRHHYKSYHTIKHQTNACRCQNGVSLPIEDYKRLGQEHGLELVNDYAPHNIFQPVLWQSADGRKFEIPYRDLKYTTAAVRRLINNDEIDEIPA